MLKYQEIIEKLTTEQKLDLIADVTSLGGVSVDEIPFKNLKISSLKNKDGWLEYPSFAGLVNSWDKNLIGEVANDVLKRSKKEGTTLVELPEVGFKISPYSEGVSEDPLLAGALVTEIALAGNRKGVATCLSDPYIKASDGDYMDKEYSIQMQEEFLGLFLCTEGGTTPRQRPQNSWRQVLQINREVPKK